MKTIDTIAGKLKIVTFNQFLLMIARSKHDDKSRHVEFNTMIGYPYVSFDDAGCGEEDTSIYERRAAYLMKGDETTIVKTALLYQGSMGFAFKKPVRELFEDIAVKSMEEFGHPTVLVRIDARTWLATNPEDFRIYENKNGIGLGCFRRASMHVIRIMPISEEQALEASLKIIANFGEYT